MADVVKKVVDAVEEAEYQAEIERNERELRKHSWIQDPHKLAVIHADLMFGRIKRSELIPVDWDKYKRLP